MTDLITKAEEQADRIRQEIKDKQSHLFLLQNGIQGDKAKLKIIEKGIVELKKRYANSTEDQKEGQ